MYCAACGKQIDNDSLFCEHCGVKVDNPFLKDAEPDNPTLEPEIEFEELSQPERIEEVPDLVSNDTEEESLRCTRCGYDLLPGSLFCDNCGAPVTAAVHETEPVREAVEPTAYSNENICKVCGGEYPAGSIFCDLCGTRIETDDIGAEPEATVDEIIASLPVPADVCTNCGADLIPGSSFCDMCGHPVGGLSEPIKADRCPVCGAELIPDSAFCDMCGEKIE